MSESTIDVGIPDHPRTLAEKVWDDHLVVKHTQATFFTFIQDCLKDRLNLVTIMETVL